MLKENSFEEKPFWMVNTRIPAEVPYRARDLSARGHNTYSNDIYFSEVHSIYSGFSPSSWHRVRAELVDEDKMGGLRLLDIIPKNVRTFRASPPFLNPVSLDIECYNPRGGMPDSETDPIIVVGLATQPDEYTINRTMYYGKEKDIFPSVTNDINAEHPDVIWTYNGNDFDLDYLVDRCEIGGYPFGVGIDGFVPTRSERSIFSIRGVPHIDLFGYANLTGSKRKAQPKVHKWMSQEGMIKSRKFYEIDRDAIAELWDSGQEDEVIKHCRSDITFTHDIGQASLPFTLELSRISKVPVDQILLVPMKVRMESYLHRYAHKLGYVIPNSQHREKVKSPGAVVFDPVKGIIYRVLVIDFKSMYPIIAIKNNISFETFQDGKWLSEPKGMFTVALEDLLLDLEVAKRTYTAKYSSKYAGEIQAIKTIARAMSPHGYLGYRNAKWYSLEAKEYELKLARRIIRKTAKVLRKKGFKIIYGDTDSVFVPVKRYDEHKFAKMCAYVQRKTGMEADWEFLQKIFFTEAKKRYIYLDNKGKIHFSGFETIRGDWCWLARHVQAVVAELVMKQEDISKAIKFVIFIVKTMKRRKLSDFIIAVGLGQDIDEYVTELAHVKIARQYGTDIGGKVEYVVTKKGRTLTQKAKHPSEIKSIEELDMTYYLEKQILPTAGRILSYFDPDFKTRVRNWDAYDPLS